MSQNFLFPLPEHEVLSLVTPSMTSADADYPPSLVADFSNGDVTAKPSLSTAFDDAWVWDFGTATRIDGVWIWHNADPGVVLRVQHNASTSWGSPTVDGTLTAPAKHKLGFTRKLFIDLTKVSGYSASGFRYFRIRFPRNSAPPGIKALAFSRFSRLTCNVARDFEAPLMQSALNLSTDFGHEWVYKLPAVREAMSLEVVVAKSTDRASLEAWFEACGRGIACCVLSTDSVHNPSSRGLIGRLTSTAAGLVQAESGLTTQVFDQRLKSGRAPVASVRFGIKELTAGLPEWT